MIISKKLQNAINAQIGNELGASLQYLQIAAYFDAETLPNLAQFFFLQVGRRTRTRHEIPALPAGSWRSSCHSRR